MPVAAGIDEVALAYTADAWGRSKRSRVVSVGASVAPLQTLQTLHGLTLVPDVAANEGLDMLPPISSDAPPGQALDQVLAAIATRYGNRTAQLVALEFEYPQRENP